MNFKTQDGFEMVSFYYCIYRKNNITLFKLSRNEKCIYYKNWYPSEMGPLNPGANLDSFCRSGVGVSDRYQDTKMSHWPRRNIIKDNKYSEQPKDMCTYNGNSKSVIIGTS